MGEETQDSGEDTEINAGGASELAHGDGRN